VNTPNKRSVKWLLIAMLIIIPGVTLLMSRISTDQEIEVQVASPTYQDLSVLVTSNGKVKPVTDFPVRAAISGMVEKIYVKVGEKVLPGQLLLQMSDPFAPERYASAESALQGAELGDQNLRNGGSQEDRILMEGDYKRAQMELEDAQKQVAMLHELAKSGAASEGEVATAQHRVDMARAGLETQHTRMTQRYSKAELAGSSGRIAGAKASLQTAKAVLANANITSGIAGTVYSLPVSARDFVNMGADLVRVADLTKLQVHAFIDEPEIGKLALRQPVRITWDAQPNRVWHGHVEQVPLTVVPMASRNVGECVITIDDGDATLLPNTDVSVSITTDERSHALTIPREALQTDRGEQFVLRVVDGHLVKTDVKTGLVNLDRVQILSGLSPADVVALHSIIPHDLHQALRVKVVQ
jgi:HlyD family secretion protein